MIGNSFIIRSAQSYFKIVPGKRNARSRNISKSWMIQIRFHECFYENPHFLAPACRVFLRRNRIRPSIRKIVYDANSILWTSLLKKVSSLCFDAGPVRSHAIVGKGIPTEENAFRLMLPLDLNDCLAHLRFFSQPPAGPVQVVRQEDGVAARPHP
ncbi:hypothetical protein SAMN02799630_02931 [Paenibacillus sp. UNCCL117]|nr:hypothetical protein SAMN04488602_10734 [Paenibacillus sp. cl123]SFW41528.1 hypothetical protein SAMN02799630_02931 [Paenibacillus sp. UNCCL117]